MKIYTFNLNWNEQNNGMTILNSCHSKIVPKTNSKISQKTKDNEKIFESLIYLF